MDPFERKCGESENSINTLPSVKIFVDTLPSVKIFVEINTLPSVKIFVYTPKCKDFCGNNVNNVM